MTDLTANTPEKKPRRHIGKMIIGFLISLVFIGLALYNVDFGKLGQIFLRVQWVWLVPGGVLIFITYFLRGVLWKQLLRKYPVRLWNLFRIITLGYFANNILPLRLGEVIRAWLLSRKENLPVSTSLATVVIERGLDLFALLSYFLLMLFLVPFEHWLKLSGLILAGIAVVFALVILLNYKYGGHLVEWIEKPLLKLPGNMGKWIHVQFEKFLQGLKLLEDTGQLLRVVLLALGNWLIWISVVYICFQAMGLDLSFLAAIFLIVVLNFGLMLPSSPGGLGVFEFMVILALKPFGIEKEVALGLGFLFHMLQYLLTLVVGWIFALQLNVSMVKAYQRSEHAEGGNGQGTDSGEQATEVETHNRASLL